MGPVGDYMASRHEEIRTSITNAHRDLVAVLDSRTPADMVRLSPNEGWTAKDTLAHLCSIESRLRDQVQSVLDGAPYPTSDVNDFNDARVAERKDWSIDRLRAELERERSITLALLDSLTDADLEREFEHPRRGRIPLAGVWQIIPNHMRAHIQDIAATKG